MDNVENSSTHSDEHTEEHSDALDIDEEWDVIDGTNELEQLKGLGDVGASLLMDDGKAGDSETAESVVPSSIREVERLTEIIRSLQDRGESLQDRNAAMEATIAELQHELSYADKARVNAEQRNAQLCATNAAQGQEIHALSEKISTMQREMESVVSEKKSLEQNTVQLESFVEETISNSQSGYNFLCEARERVADITNELARLRDFAYGTTSGSVADEREIGFKGGVLQSVNTDLNVTLSVYKEIFADLSAEVRRLKALAGKPPGAAAVAPFSNERSNQIALTNFKEGEVAMFFPTPNSDYVAFNIGTPHHYLSEESKALIGHDPHFKKVYVLGRIVMKEQKVAPEVDAPYNLKPGTTYYEISVESIADMFPAAAMRGSDHKFRENTGIASASRRRKA